MCIGKYKATYGHPSIIMSYYFKTICQNQWFSSWQIFTKFQPENIWIFWFIQKIWILTTEWTSSCILVVLKRFKGLKVTSYPERKKKLESGMAMSKSRENQSLRGLSSSLFCEVRLKFLQTEHKIVCHKYLAAN